MLAISLGCPAGIGPEIAVVAAAGLEGASALFVGDPEVIAEAAALRGVRREVALVESRRELAALPRGRLAVWRDSAALSGRLVPGRPDAAAGAAQLAWVDQATDLVRTGLADALVTAPVSKLAIAASGARGASRFRGHTEHLARRLGAREVTMAFWSETLTTALVTTHLPLARVPRAIRPEGVARTTYWLCRLVAALGKRAPRIAVAALNPHAGEGGLLGHEEERVIRPGIELARARLEADALAAHVDGPLGAETAFRLASAGRYDAVVAMYHDQATIPSKLVAFGDAVNVTLGLPIVRTSVDHGTAYDVAWKASAEASSMLSALELAARLARSRGRRIDA